MDSHPDSNRARFVPDSGLSETEWLRRDLLVCFEEACRLTHRLFDLLTRIENHTVAVPAAPCIITAEWSMAMSPTVTGLSLQWNSVDGAAGYRLYVIKAGVPAQVSTTIPAGTGTMDSTTISLEALQGADPDIVGGEALVVAMSASNAAGESPLSSVVSIAPAAGGPQPPASPEGIVGHWV